MNKYSVNLILLKVTSTLLNIASANLFSVLILLTINVQVFATGKNSAFSSAFSEENRIEEVHKHFVWYLTRGDYQED